MNNFNQLSPAPMDQIMLANAAWPDFQRNHADPVKTTVGVMAEPDDGFTWRPQSVIQARKEAEEFINQNRMYDYQSPQGHIGFLQNAERAIFGNEDFGIDLTGYQTIGGTHALSTADEVLGVLLKKDDGKRLPLLLDPGWPNHPAIFGERNFEITTYAHRGPGDHYNHYAALEAIAQQPDDSTVLFQVNGYNDDGLDRTVDQWDHVLELANVKNMTVILDAAYLGLTGEIAEDAYPIRKARELGLFGFVCVSTSKNMGQYNERLGAVYAVNAQWHLGPDQAKYLDQTIKRIVRRVISNPPLLVAEAATRVLEPDTVESEAYQAELWEAREQLIHNRQLFAEATGHRFPTVMHGRGLFTKLLAAGFSKPQQDVLAHEGILALPSSRFNLGGIPARHIERVGAVVLKAVETADAD